MTERVVLRDRDDVAVAELLVGVVGERARHLAGGVSRDAQHVGDARALGQVICGDDGNEVGDACRLCIFGHCKAGVGQQITDEEVDLGLFGQFARLLQRDIRIGAVVLDEDLDLSAARLLADLVPVEIEPFDDFLAAGGDDAGQGRQQADLDRAGALGQRLLEGPKHGEAAERGA